MSEGGWKWAMREFKVNIRMRVRMLSGRWNDKCLPAGVRSNYHDLCQEKHYLN